MKGSLAGRGIAAAVAAAVALAGPSAGTASASPPMRDFGFGYLGYCKTRSSTAATWSCYVRGLLQDIERSHDPANELPRLDRVAHKTGGYLEGNCHMMMHVIGRTYARRHHVSLTTLQRYLPRSNDPGCSAGFGMGLVMALGPQLERFGPRGAVQMCLRAPTRYRRYTCVHSLGHAYMRLYSGYLSYALTACRALGLAESRDCAQGAFHDYWLSLSGRDGTIRRPNEVRSPRTLCGRQQSTFVLPCWYRYFLERPPKHLPGSAHAVASLCHGLTGLQRSGCIAAASLVSAPDPFAQTRICARLRNADIVSCLHGVGVQNLARSGTKKQVALIRMCGGLSTGSQRGCYSWFGRTLAVITNGNFAADGCIRLVGPVARSACAAGARQMNEQLVTFS